MSVIYIFSTFLALAALWLHISAWRDKTKANSLLSLDYDKIAFNRFQIIYLIPTGLAYMCDWLTGSYTYSRYLEFGLSVREINTLYLIGLLSAAFASFVVGPLADRWGRRAACLMFPVVSITTDILFQFTKLPLLVLHRLIGGFKGCILWTCFETWMVRRHRALGFPDELMSLTFALAALINAFGGILSGIVTSAAMSYGGTSLVFLTPTPPALVVAIVVAWFWATDFPGVSTINSQQQPEKKEWYNELKIAGSILREDRSVLLLGIIQSMFGSALMLMVVNWTPALDPQVNHGRVFTLFMLGMTAGSGLLPKVTSWKVRTEVFVGVLLGLAASAYLIAAIQKDNLIRVLAFVSIECTAGAFYPAMSELQSRLLPEKIRSTLTSLFRFPLEAIPAIVLAVGHLLTVESIFLICGLLCSVGVVSAGMLTVIIKRRVDARVLLSREPVL